MCPHPGSWSLAVAPPCLADDTKIIPSLIPGGGEDTATSKSYGLIKEKETISDAVVFEM